MVLQTGDFMSIELDWPEAPAVSPSQSRGEINKRQYLDVFVSSRPHFQLPIYPEAGLSCHYATSIV